MTTQTVPNPQSSVIPTSQRRMELGNPLKQYETAQLVATTEFFKPGLPSPVSRLFGVK